MLNENFVLNLEETRTMNYYTMGLSEVFNYKDYEITVCTDTIKGKECKLILVLREAGKLEEQDIKFICEHFLGNNYISQYSMGGTVFNAWKV